MLVSFRVENFLSLKDPQELSMIAGPDREMEDTHCFKPASDIDWKLLKSAALFGANASGKSNLLRAINFMRDLIILSSSGEKIAADTGFIPFKLDKKKPGEPGFFEITFVVGDRIYIYGFKIDEVKVVSEWLYFYPQKRRVLLFKREIVEEEELKLTGSSEGEVNYHYKFGPHFKGEKNKIKSLTRKNSLYLTVGAQFNHPVLLKVFKWFSDFLKPWIPPEVTMGPTIFTSRLINEDNEMKKRIVSLLRRADLGIKDVKVETVKKDQFPNFEKLPESLKKEIEKELEEGHIIDIKMVHSAASGNTEITANFDFEEESMGTRRMFQLAGPLLHVLTDGGILVIDEIEDSLHIHLLKALLTEFFENPKNAQIIFTTHNVQLLEDRLFRRDEIWLTEKKEDGGTELFSLADFKPKPRKDKSLKNGYLTGAYGAIPVLGELLSE